MAKKKTVKLKLPPFPKQIYLTDSDDADDHFFLQYENLDAIDDDARVAVYELVRIGKLAVKRELVKP